MTTNKQNINAVTKLSAHILSRRFIAFTALISMAAYLVSCESPRVTKTFYAMGGIPVNIIAVGLSDTTLQRVTEKAAQSVEEWEAELSMYRESSAINQLHKKKDTPVLLTAKGWQALQAAREAETITGGAFDVTIGPVVRLWKDAEKKGVLPDSDALAKALSFTGFDNLIFDESNRSIRVNAQDSISDDEPESGFVLDVGGIAKGLFAEWLNDQIVESLTQKEKNCLKKLIVDLSGDMYVRSFTKNDLCVVGIRDPFSSDRSKLWGTLSIQKGAVVTSGTYERYFEIDGRRYCHIIDPKTGYPVSNDIVSVTIVDPSGAMADALATAVFVLGEEKGIELIHSRVQTEMVLIRSDKTWFASEGLRNNLRQIDLTRH
ncbi:MAG: FAD:protein FMN transferase [bacterium]